MNICIECKKKRKVKENGVIVIETYLENEPYKLYRADLYECPTCGGLELGGFSNPTYARECEDIFGFINNHVVYYFE